MRLEETGENRYRRTLGNIYIGETWVNLSMVEKGMAWFFRQYSRDKSLVVAEK